MGKSKLDLTVPGADLSAFASRLREALASSSFRSGSALADAIGCSPTSVNNWVRGIAEPGRDRLIATAQCLGVNLLWLATGEGDMHTGSNQSRATDAASLDEKMLAAAIDLIETWLAQNRRKMEPAKKAQVIVMAYEILTESGDSEIRESDRNNVVRLLRVAS